MKNYIEKGPERIPTRDEVMEVISRLAENSTVVRELTDEQGLYLLEANIEGEEEGEVIQYQYMRKGRFPDNKSASDTGVCVVYFQGGVFVSGTTVAKYNPETGEWREIK